MPSSAVQIFSDPDAYAAAVRGAAVALTVVGRGEFEAKLTRIQLHRLWMQRFSEKLPRIVHVASAQERVHFTLRTQAESSFLVAGVETDPSAIVHEGQVHDYYNRSSGPADFGAMSLPIEDLASFGEVMSGVDLTAPRDATSVTPPAAAMDKLQRLHAAAGRLAEDAPEIIANPDAARGLEQALIEALVACLSHRDERANSLARVQHAIVMRRFHNVVEENLEEPLYIPEICKAIGASESTLRICCLEHLGMSPKHYLLRRRMHLARQALRRAEHDATSVTAVATRYGFWELGRFAVVYQSLFGEPPSATLRRQPE